MQPRTTGVKKRKGFFGIYMQTKAPKMQKKTGLGKRHLIRPSWGSPRPIPSDQTKRLLLLELGLPLLVEIHVPVVGVSAFQDAFQRRKRPERLPQAQESTKRLVKHRVIEMADDPKMAYEAF